MDSNIVLIAALVLFAIYVVLFTYLIIFVSRSRKRVRRELSGEEGAFTGPAGEPIWRGVLPPKVDDYVEPRYVYENLVESTEFLPENGRIIGYRISPDLVIHSRILKEINSPCLNSYIQRLGGKLLDVKDVFILQKNWEAVSALLEKAGDSPLKAEWFWASFNSFPVVMHYQRRDVYQDVIGFSGVWYTLILKR